MAKQCTNLKTTHYLKYLIIISGDHLINITRYALNNYEKIRITSAKEKSLLKFIGPNVWISIPLHIKKAKTVKEFIDSYRSHLIENYDDS